MCVCVFVCICVCVCVYVRTFTTLVICKTPWWCSRSPDISLSYALLLPVHSFFRSFVHSHTHTFVSAIYICAYAHHITSHHITSHQSCTAFGLCVCVCMHVCACMCVCVCVLLQHTGHFSELMTRTQRKDIQFCFCYVSLFGTDSAKNIVNTKAHQYINMSRSASVCTTYNDVDILSSPNSRDSSPNWKDSSAPRKHNTHHTQSTTKPKQSQTQRGTKNAADGECATQ